MNEDQTMVAVIRVELVKIKSTMKALSKMVNPQLEYAIACQQEIDLERLLRELLSDSH